MEWTDRIVALATAATLVLLLGRAWGLVEVSARSSLWGDEITSIEMFSGRGLAVCLTDYSIPNNHVLFNALNSVLPGSGSFEPLRARIVSVSALAIGFVLAVFVLARRGAWLVGLTFGLAYLGDDRLLGVHLAARGYGMVALAAVLVCVLVWQYLEPRGQVDSGRSRQMPVLVALAGSVVGGALTVPTFLFFGGSVLLSLFLLRRTWRHFFAGAIVFVTVVGYFGWLYVSNHGFAEAPAGFFEGEFHELSAVAKLAQRYSLEGWHDGFRAVAALLMLAAPWMALKNSPRRATLWCLWWGIVGSLVICLIMKRPLMHTVAHLLIPAGFLVGLGLESLAGNLSQRPRWRWLPTALGSVLALFVAGSALRPRDPLSMWPVESWREIAETISAISGQPSVATSVWAPYRGNLLTHYLPEEIRVAAQPDESAQDSGGQFVVASAGTKYAGEVVEPGVLEPMAVRLSVRQKANSLQRIGWNPPARQRVEILEAGPKPGTTSGKTFALRLRMPAADSSDDGGVLYLYSDDPIMNKAPTVLVTRQNGKQQRLEPVAVGTMWAVKLGQSVDRQTPLEVIYYSGSAGDLPPGFVAWVGDSIPPDYTRSLLF